MGHSFSKSEKMKIKRLDTKGKIRKNKLKKVGEVDFFGKNSSKN